MLKEMVAHKVEDNTARDDNVLDDELAKVVNDIVVGIAHSELPGVGRMNRQLVEVANETAAAAAAAAAASSSASAGGGGWYLQIEGLKVSTSGLCG